MKIRYSLIIVITIALAFVSYEHLTQAPSTSKSSTISLVSSVPLRDPTAHISFVSLALWEKQMNNYVTNHIYNIKIHLKKNWKQIFKAHTINKHENTEFEF